ncbi:MAG: hypothetical protein PHC95_15870, partial [Parabacteroides sp.]|nr:hypothetical protein [Parabacteroides sp.]
GGNVTVKIVPKEGYEVQQLNVDTVSQGAVDSYTFNVIDANHTMYVWMSVESASNPTDFLVRSDKPDVYYSSLHVALNAIKSDYPDKLTRDVTLSCVKTVTETRNPQDENKLTNERLFVSVLKNWNKDSLFVLTVDGDGKYTLNGNSLGCLRFENVDNVIIRNINFIDFANYAKFSSPEEMSAVTFIGEDGNTAKSLYVDNCSFDGIYNGSGSYYTIITKLTENVSVCNSVLKNNSAMTFKLTDTKLISLVKNTISGIQKVGLVGHPGIFTNSGTIALYIDDNDINGASFSETAFYISNTQNIYIRRNKFYNHVGRILEVSSNAEVQNFIFNTNLIHDTLFSPIFSWIQDMLSIVTDLNYCECLNNTVFFNGTLYRQWFLRASANYCNKLVNCNNLFIEATSGNAVNSVFQILGVKEYESSGNVYKADLNTTSDNRFVAMQMMVSANSYNLPQYLTIAGNDARSLSYYNDKGYEAGSKPIAKSTKLLNVESGGTTYGLIASIANAYLSDTAKAPALDLNYKQNVYMTSAAAINHNGVGWDEGADATTGYDGMNIESSDRFDQQGTYTIPSDDTIVLVSKSKNRASIVKFHLIGTDNSYLCIGKNAIFTPACKLNGDGTYSDIQTYNTEIEK